MSLRLSLAVETVAGGGRQRSGAELAGLRRGRALGPSDRVALSLTDPLALIDLLAALDGQVAALLLVSHAQPGAVLAGLAQATGCTVIVSDRADLGEGPGQDAGLPLLRPEAAMQPAEAGEAEAGGAAAVATEWLMTTSGTTGLPKIILHTLASLARTVARLRPGAGPVPVWGLLYDPTRFAGMQVTLQALIGGGRLVAVDTGQPLARQVADLAAAGCTHLSATPTLWRRLLMVPGLAGLPLRQITLGGETVAQDVLDALGAAFPQARRTHIYASTEAGVGFAVNDGQAGFPAGYLASAPGGVALKIVDDILWLRPPGPPRSGPPRSAAPGIETDAEGFIRSGDLIRIEGGRAQFLGRENGLINVGGVKVYPEVVERVIARVPGVRLVQVSSKKSPITGALVVADVLAGPQADRPALKAAIQTLCRAELGREAVPGLIRFVGDLEINVAGKLIRRSADGG